VIESRDIPWVLDRAIVFGLPIVVLALLSHAGTLGVLDDVMGQAPPSLPFALFAIAVMGPPAILVHELGHAVAARLLVGGAITLRIGGRDTGLRMRMGGVTVSLDPVGSLATGGGAVQFDPGRGTLADALAIVLAGPFASFLGAVVSLRFLYGATSPYEGVSALLWAFFLLNVIATVNVLPFRVRERRDGPMVRSDGRLVMDMLAAAWALR
jgi:hypothetical protein